MKIVIRTKNLKLTKNLENFIGEKINSLEKFLEIFQKKYYNHFFGKPHSREISLRGKGKPRIEAWIEIGKETLHHQKGKVFRAECQMRLPSKSLRSEAISKNLRQAVTEVKDELQRELKQYKEKLAALTKRRARVFKKELKLVKEARFYRKGRIREEGI